MGHGSHGSRAQWVNWVTLCDPFPTLATIGCWLCLLRPRGMKRDDEAVRVAVGLALTYASHISVYAERKSMLGTQFCLPTGTGQSMSAQGRNHG